MCDLLPGLETETVVSAESSFRVEGMVGGKKRRSSRVGKIFVGKYVEEPGCRSKRKRMWYKNQEILLFSVFFGEPSQQYPGGLWYSGSNPDLLHTACAATL